MRKQNSRMFFPAVGFCSFFISSTLSAATLLPVTQVIQAAPVPQVQPVPAAQPVQAQSVVGQPVSIHPAPVAVSPSEAIKQAAKLTKQSEFSQAFETALRAKRLNDPNPLFIVDYLNTLLSIVESAEATAAKVPDAKSPDLQTELTARIMNEAATTIESLKTNPNYDGRNNPESAYFFMLAVSKCAEAILPTSETAHFSLQICAGNIARNLRTNPNYPVDSMESLSVALIGMAKGHALAGNQPAATQCITEAAELGFGQFADLATNACMLKLRDQVSLKSHLEKLDAAYQAKLAQWSRAQIDQFQSFNYELNVEDVEGGILDAEKFEDKILVVDFWATWCPPCREGIPHFVKLQEQFESEDVQVLGVSMDSPDDPRSARGTVKKFLKKNHVNYPCGLGTDQATQNLPGEVKLPTTVFIDRLGNVRYIANGYHDHAKLAAITKALTNEGRHVRTTLQRLRSRAIAD